MTWSPLTARVAETSKRSSRNGRTVERLIVHHTAGNTNEGNLQVLAYSTAKKSCTYLLETDGDLVGIVPEEYRPWTSGSAAADGNSVTVETVNTTGAPAWRVADVQVERLAQLAADLCRRYGWGHVDANRVKGHRDFDSTACPGPYLYPLIPLIIARANEILTTGGDDMAVDIEAIAARVWLIGHKELGGNARDFLANLPVRIWTVRHGVLGNRTAYEALATIEGKVDGLLAAVKEVDGVDPEMVERVVRESVSKALAAAGEAIAASGESS